MNVIDLVKWDIRGRAIRRKLDKVNMQLAIQDSVDFENAVRQSVANMKQKQRELQTMHKHLKKAVKAM